MNILTSKKKIKKGNHSYNRSGRDIKDWDCNWKKSTYQPDLGWYPLTEKYLKDKWRFNEKNKHSNKS